jgi:hypothetical protein
MLPRCGQHAGADFTWLVQSYLISTAVTSGMSAITYSASAASLAFGDEQQLLPHISFLLVIVMFQRVAKRVVNRIYFFVAFVNATKKLKRLNLVLFFS